MRVRDGSRSFRGSFQDFLQVRDQMLFRGVFSGPAAANALCLSFQLTVYLGKRDFVDHIDLVDPVGEFPEAREERAGEVGQARPLEGAVSKPLAY